MDDLKLIHILIYYVKGDRRVDFSV